MKLCCGIDELTKPVHSDTDRRTCKVSYKISEAQRNDRCYKDIHLSLLGDHLT